MNNLHSNTTKTIEDAQRVLKSTYGYSAFRLHQEDIIEALLNGQDVLTLMPTGGGKSLCFQIPAILRDGTGIIISPLIALMQDQVESLTQLGIKVACINSTRDNQQNLQTEQALLNGELDLLYVAPERLLMARMLDLLDQVNISLFAIDEAHCVSQWGHDFRKEYQRLCALHERYPDVPRIALTATADNRTRQEIIEQLDLKRATVFINSFDRPNIHYCISDANSPRDQLWRFIQQHHPKDAGIVYCLSRKKVEAIAEWLQSKGRIALPYHAGLADQVRHQHQQQFQREESIIIVATIAFGMGIDKPDVRFVAHLSLPKSIEAYYQETGRAGRDAKPANAWMVYGLQDIITLRHWVQEADSDEQHKRVAQQKLDSMLGLCELTSCRRQTLLSYFNERLEHACGNCDNCIDPPQSWDATVVAQKALSCVYRTGQLFGVNYLIDVLIGKENERILRNRHNTISTFGIGNELSALEWRSIFRQLITTGYLTTDSEGHGSLILSEKCRGLLRGESRLELRKLRKTPSAKQNILENQPILGPMDQTLYQALRSLRQQLAKEQGVPAYVIFHDRTLDEIARRRPATLDQMRTIHGVGERKLDLYGNTFLAEIAAQPRSALVEDPPIVETREISPDLQLID